MADPTSALPSSRALLTDLVGRILITGQMSFAELLQQMKLKTGSEVEIVIQTNHSPNG